MDRRYAVARTKHFCTGGSVEEPIVSLQKYRSAAGEKERSDDHVRRVIDRITRTSCACESYCIQPLHMDHILLVSGLWPIRSFAVSEEWFDPALPAADPTAPLSHTAAERQRASFVVRVWRSTENDVWRCHLIHVESGRHLVCDQISMVGERITDWLQRMPQSDRGGLR